MQKKFKRLFFVFFLLFTAHLLFCEAKTFFVFQQYDDAVKKLPNDEALFLDYVTDFLTDTLSADNQFAFAAGDKKYDLTDASSVSKITNYTLFNGGYGFLTFRGYVSDNNVLRYDISVYGNNDANPLLQMSYDFYVIDMEAVLLDAHLFFAGGISQITDCLDKIDIKPFTSGAAKSSSVKKTKKERNYPLVSLSLMTTSVKLYFDQRTSTKIFSFFPVNLFVSFYPLRYMEVGLFFKTDYDDMVFQYYDVSRGTNDYYGSTFKFAYGFHIGLSFFAERYHYSLGVQAYNFHLYMANDWSKTGDYRSEFLPQFALYQKVDVKIFKMLYYSVQVNIKTLQKFTLDENKTFYSSPFQYDFFAVEIMLLGFSLFF